MLSFKSLIRAAVLGLAAIVLATTVSAEPLLPVISQTYVHRVDPVDAAKGSPTIGSPEFAYRDGDTVRYFSSAENCGAYVLNTKKFPDADAATKLAFFGADIVLRFPNGVHTPDLGPIIAGNPRFAFTDQKHGAAVFLFQNQATRAMFVANPDKYVPAVGGYCPGAMAGDHVTPGDPRNAYYIAEAHIWGAFGSPNGPVAWARMTPDQRRAKYAAAVANYERRTGLAAAAGKVALAH